MGRTSDARERLLEAAQRLVWEQSYGAVGVDAICQAAGVKKGSFYHFFASKAELVAAALEAKCAADRPALDDVFSPSRPPLARLEAWFQALEAVQRTQREACGHTLGCPLAGVGGELATQEPGLAARVHGLMDTTLRYVESAVRDAQARGEVRADAPAEELAAALFTHLEGVMVQARIADDPAIAERLRAGARLLLAPPTAGSASSSSRSGRARRPRRSEG